MKTRITVELAALLVAPVLFAEPVVTRVFRPVRDARGDENVRRVQDIDDAAWVWAPGHVVWGVAGESAAWNVRFGMQAAPDSFFRLRNRFTADGSPLELVPYGCAKLRVSMFPDDAGKTDR